jgi:hypothetical protein
LASLALCTCSSSSSGKGGVNESPAPQCHDLANVADKVQIVQKPDPPPPEPDLGGAIADGTYVRTSATLYGSPSTDKVIEAHTIAVTGGKWFQTVTEYNGDKGFDTRTTFGVEVGPTAVKLTPTCSSNGATDVQGYDYKATDKGLSLFSHQGLYEDFVRK